MKIFQLSIIFLFAGVSLATAQTGINTNAPASTLDIVAKNPTGTTTNVDGLLIPRLDRQRAQSMTAVPTSTLIYVNSIATGTLAGTAVNIDATGYYYFNGTAWVKIDPSLNIYNTNGTLAGTRTVTTNGNSLSFVNGTSNVGIATATTQGIISATGPSRGSITFNGGSANLDMYVDNANAAQINTSGNSTKLSIGTTNASPVALKANGAERLTMISNGNVGIGTAAPNTRLEVSSGTANSSGVRFTNLTSASPIAAGQSIGVDASGNIITVANPTPASINTATVNSTTGADYNVNDLAATIVTGTSQSITIPAGGKALFINFMLGIDYVGFPAGGGQATYEARLYIDGVATDCYLRTQETSAGTNTQFTINTVKFLTAGSHTLDVRMRRVVNNGTTSGANAPCRPISMSFNASYIN
ncbi:hypothetical protein [Chryseobacterium kwangjuense]|uniref:C1q domain-containing protein n=1 Tax=Chryseobacterium kwangjuense TaxID=267125 RepID=A0A135WKC2_9FLAO|nr:hypothetical protein [Chryseobacterium kwangjuense]KXH85358.1 hypothetical protein AU378_06315 [Chryseobacterium kwangjuense]